MNTKFLCFSSFSSCLRLSYFFPLSLSVDAIPLVLVSLSFSSFSCFFSYIRRDSSHRLRSSFCSFAFSSCMRLPFFFYLPFHHPFVLTIHPPKSQPTSQGQTEGDQTAKPSSLGAAEEALFGTPLTRTLWQLPTCRTPP